MSSISLSCGGSHNFNSATLKAWLNGGYFNNSTQLLATYYCAYLQYIDWQEVIDFLRIWVFVIGGSLGILSALLVLMTLCRNENFSAKSFFYFRVIAALEIITSSGLIIAGYSFSTNNWKSNYGMYLMIYIRPIIQNLAGNTIDGFMVYLSLERAVASLLPSKFYLLDLKYVRIIVCCVAVCQSVITAIPPYFQSEFLYSNATGIYSTKNIDSNFFPIFNKFLAVNNFVFAAVVFVSSLLAVLGMLQALRSRLALTKSSNTVADANSNKKRKETVNKNLQLCYLQLSQAMPMAINYILFSAKTLYIPGGFGLDELQSGVNFEKAMSDLNSRYIPVILQLCVTFSNICTHCAHFYLYMIMSGCFRDGFRRRFCRTKVTVAPVVSAPATVSVRKTTLGARHS